MTPKTRTSEARTASVMALIEEYTACWNAKDLQRYGSFFTEDAEFTDITGQSALGREAIIKQHEFPFKVVLKEATLAFEHMLIRDLSDKLVMASGGWAVTGSKTPKGDPLPERQGIMHFICEEAAGQWLIKLVYNADVKTVYWREERDTKGPQGPPR